LVELVFGSPRSPEGHMSYKNRNVFDFVEHKVLVEKEIARRFTASFMSNAKWRKLFLALDENWSELQVIWKLIWYKNDGVREGLPRMRAIESEYLNSYFWLGSMYYKEIEWIEFPWIEFPRKGIPSFYKQVPAAHWDQDIEAVRGTIESLGQFMLEESPLGFRLLGYQ
jgi:hypothetical protein